MVQSIFKNKIVSTVVKKIKNRYRSRLLNLFFINQLTNTTLSMNFSRVSAKRIPTTDGDDFKVKFPKAGDRDFFFRHPDLMHSQVVQKAFLVRDLYGIDAVDILENKANYKEAPDKDGCREFKKDFVPLDPMLLHSGYMGTHTVNITEIEKIKNNASGTKRIQLPTKKKTFWMKSLLAKRILNLPTNQTPSQ